MTKAKRVSKRRPLPCRATDLERGGSGRSDPIRCALFPFEACLLHEVVVRTVRLVPEVHSPPDLVRTEEQAVHRRACPVAYLRSICSWQRLQEAEKERLWFEIESSRGRGSEPGDVLLLAHRLRRFSASIQASDGRSEARRASAIAMDPAGAPHEADPQPQHPWRRHLVALHSQSRTVYSRRNA